MVFVELAGVALLPYALAVAAKFKFYEPQPLVLYDLVFLAVLGSNVVVGRRGFGRRWRSWSEAERRVNWRRIVVQSVLCGLFAIGIGIAIAFPHFGWAPYWFILPVSFGLRRLYRGLPAFARDVPGGLPQVSET
jgi:cytochrome c biogenesis factor